MASSSSTKELTGNAFSEINWKDPDSIKNGVRTLWSKRNHRRLALDRQWDINIAMYCGYQNLVWKDQFRGLREEIIPSWRVRFIANLLQGVVIKRCSKVLRNKPTWTALPATLEPEDELSNTVANRVLRYYWRYLHMNRKILDACLWLFCTGNVFIRPLWDPTKGAEMMITPKDMVGPYGAEEGTPEEETEEGLIDEGGKMLKDLFGGGGGENGILTGLGDPDIEVCSPYEIEVDPAAVRIDDAAWVLHSKARSIQWIKDMYPKTTEGIEEDQVEDDKSNRYFETRIRDMVGQPGGSTENRSTDGYLIVHELSARPCGDYPNGIHVVVAGNRIVKPVGPLPYFRDLGYAHTVDVPVPGRLWGTSVLEQCIPAQMDYNRRRSQLIENMNLMGRPKWFVPTGSGLMAAALTSEPGEIVEYNLGFKPEAWRPDSVDPSFYKGLDLDRRDIEDQAAVHEVSQGRNPAGVRTAAGIAQLQEQDDTMLAPTALLLEDAVAAIGQWLLQIIAKHVTEPRLLKIVGNDHVIEVKTFLGQDIVGPNAHQPGVNYFDVEVSLGSQLPASKAGRQEMIERLVAMKLLDADRDRDEIRRLIGLGSEDPFYDQDRLDRSNAVNENMQLAQGYFVEPQPYDNPAIHQPVHLRFMKTPEFKRLPPQAQAVFFQHVEKTEQQLTPSPAPMQPQPGQEQGMGPERSPEFASPEMYPPEGGGGPDFADLAAQRRVA
jgi:hypothetical protein